MISILVISEASAWSTPEKETAFERIVVTPDANSDTSPKMGERRLRSTAPPARRLNLSISLASGEWVVPVTGDVEPCADWVPMLERELTANSTACVLILQGEGDSVLFAIRRRAFAYGAVDERLHDAQAALFDWMQRIFPSHKYRTIGCEGIQHIQMPGFLRLASPDIATTGASDARLSSQAAPVTLVEKYEPKHFWSQATSDYVKWEVFQPDEPEIEEVLRLTRPKRVLELGCGAGRNIRYFAGCEQYVGIDIAGNLLRRASDRVEANALGLLRGDVVQLPLAPATFDLVFSTSTIQHVIPERIEECIADILRVSARYVCLIEFVDELPEHPGWFQNIHMFKHDYAGLMQGRARLLHRRTTGLQIQPAVKECFLFEKI